MTRTRAHRKGRYVDGWHNGHVAESNHLASLRVSSCSFSFFFPSSFLTFFFPLFFFFQVPSFRMLTRWKFINPRHSHQDQALFSPNQKRYLPKCLEWMRVFETICNSIPIGNTHDDVPIMFDTPTCVCLSVCMYVCVCFWFCINSIYRN